MFSANRLVPLAATAALGAACPASWRGKDTPCFAPDHAVLALLEPERPGLLCRDLVFPCKPRLESELERLVNMYSNGCFRPRESRRDRGCSPHPLPSSSPGCGDPERASLPFPVPAAALGRPKSAPNAPHLRARAHRSARTCSRGSLVPSPSLLEACLDFCCRDGDLRALPHPQGLGERYPTGVSVQIEGARKVPACVAARWS